MLTIETKFYPSKHFCVLVLYFVLCVFNANAQTTIFTHQDKLPDSSANGDYEFQVRLFDAQTGGTEISSTNIAAAVINGKFKLQLDFGAAAFNGDTRYWKRKAGKLTN